MALKENESGEKKLLTKRSLVAIAILLFTFPGALTAQEPKLPCKAGPGDPVLTWADYDRNENSSGGDDGAGTPNQSIQAANSGHNDWVRAWLRKVDQVRASQPHFVSPIVTTHVMLVQQFRYDMSWQQDPATGVSTSNYGASKGLEIIPLSRLQVRIFPPNYLEHQSSQPHGFGDFSFQLKFRAFSAT